MKTGRLRPPPPPRDDSDDVDPEDVAARTLAGAAVLIDVMVPRTSVRGRMRVLTRREVGGLKAAARQHFIELDLPGSPAELSVLGMHDEWAAELALRHLAIAVRDPKDESKPLASLDEWGECDDDQIVALWERYKDHRDTVDPLASEALSDEDRAAIETAVKKKDVELLTSYGSRNLSLFMLSTADPPAT